MAKKTPGPKEAAMKAQREAASVQPGLPYDTAAILAEIDAFKRSKVQPIKEEIARLQQQRREIDESLNRLNMIEADLEGRALGKTIRSNGAGGSGKRFRPSPEEVAAAAEAMGTAAKNKFGTKNEFARKDLLALIDPKWTTHLAKLIDAWNASNKDHKLGTNGKEKTLSRYLFH